MQKKPILLYLVLLVTLGQFGVDLYLPSMPFIAESLQSSFSSVKLTLPLYLLGFGISQLFYGPLSDVFGRRPLLLFGLMLFLLSSIGCFFSQNIEFLIAFRVLQGLGIGSATVSVRAITRDVYHGKGLAKASALITMVWAITPIVAPVLGGYIQTYLGWRANFSTMFFYAALVWLLVFFLLPETLDREHKKRWHVPQIMKTYGHLFSSKVFLSFSVMSSLCYGYFICYATVSPFLFQTQLGLTPVEYGWALLLIAFGTIIGSIICNRIVGYVSIKKVMLIGSLILFFSTLALFFSTLGGYFNKTILILFPAIGCIGTGMLFPNCTTGAMTPYKKEGGISGATLGFIQMVNSFIFSFILSHFKAESALPLATMLLIIAALICTLFFVVVARHFVEEGQS